MSTALPASGDPGPTKLCDTSDLVLAHLSFRRLYSLAPDAVRHADPRDRGRIASVAKNVARINDALHHHHTIEDEKLWDRLEARKPACTLHVEVMKTQHAQVAALLAEAPALIDAWVADPTPATTESLAAKLDEISRTLGEHLTLEEERILPVVEEVITAQEWDDVGQAAMKSYHRSQIFLFYGLILEIVSPGERAELEKEVPTAIKVMYALVGRRQYERIMRDLRPAA